MKKTRITTRPMPAILVGILLVAALSAGEALARLDTGGRVSRDITIGQVSGGEESLYATTWGYPGDATHATVWAFAVNPPHATCYDADANPKACDDLPLKWFHPLSHSDGFRTFSPPAVTADGEIIIVASEDGYVYALDHKRGEELWSYYAGEKFWAKPVIHEPGRVVYAGSLNGGIFAIDIDSGQAISGWPVDLGSAKIRCTPVIDDVHADGMRIYVGLGNTLYAVSLSSGEILWSSPAASTFQMMCGGVLVQNSVDRVLVVNSADHLSAFYVDGPKTGQLYDPWKTENGGAGNPSKSGDSHRTYPALSTARDPEHPAIYIQMKGPGSLHRYDFEDGSPGYGVQMFPESGVAGNTSFSAPSVNHAGPTAGFIFYGPARNNGMYRIDPANIPAGDGPANVWFDHTPPGNWRTNGAFSQDGSKVFMGSANGLVFSLDTAAEDPVVDGVNWVFDTITGALDETLWPFEPDPGGAGNPVPLNGAIDVSRASDIAWTSSAGATSHDVYFGTDNPPAFIGNQAGTSFDPGVLAAGTTYYWRIDEVSAQGTTTGDTWSFTTEAAIDTDGDGLDDWYETMVLGTNPGSVDSDGDGLVDGAGGVVSTSTYPAGIDIDADGFVDGEQDFGTDAAVSNLGDVAPRNNLDNLIDLGDLLVLTRLVTGTVLPGGLEMINGDINGDTRLDAADILLLQQALLNGTAP